MSISDARISSTTDGGQRRGGNASPLFYDFIKEGFKMKAANITDFTICKTHCDWIVHHAKELKALFGYNSERMIELNKTRAMSDVDTMMDSLRELKAYISEI
ncbi:MAG: hypothetical protein NC548_45300 [Lachnospiraceae bacterium]|nr:hypothetical protein [Lachnospiraceae bacterium]